MPFTVIVGNHPVYVLLVELKSENSEIFASILLFMGSLHVQMSFINAISKTYVTYVIFTLLELILVIQQRVSYSLLWDPNHIDKLNTITRI